MLRQFNGKLEKQIAKNTAAEYYRPHTTSTTIIKNLPLSSSTTTNSKTATTVTNNKYNGLVYETGVEDAEEVKDYGTADYDESSEEANEGEEHHETTKKADEYDYNETEEERDSNDEEPAVVAAAVVGDADLGKQIQFKSTTIIFENKRIKLNSSSEDYYADENPPVGTASRGRNEDEDDYYYSEESEEEGESYSDYNYSEFGVDGNRSAAARRTKEPWVFTAKPETSSRFYPTRLLNNSAHGHGRNAGGFFDTVRVYSAVFIANIKSLFMSYFPTASSTLFYPTVYSSSSPTIHRIRAYDLIYYFAVLIVLVLFSSSLNF
jgi:hypothetical protein